MNMKYALIAAFAGLLLLSSCSSIQQPSDPASATLTIEGVSGAYYASASSGDGTLFYENREIPFSITALGAGGSGGISISATGQVYKLDSLEDFAGTYSAKRKGITLGAGKFTALLTSERGVQIYLEGETKGLGSSMGVSSVQIKLK
jgi:hypothetical protein